MTQEREPGDREDDALERGKGSDDDAMDDPALGLPPMPSFGTASWMPAAAGNVPAPNAITASVRAAHEAAAGDELFLRLRFDDAWRRYQEAIRLDADNERYHAKLGTTALNAGRLDVAERHLLEAIRLAPQYSPAHESLAFCYIEAGKWELALKHADISLALDPLDVDRIVSRAAILNALGRQEEAWESIKPIVDAGSINPGLAMVMAALARNVGRERQCLSLIERSLNAGAPLVLRSRLHFAAAALLDKMGEYDRAFVHARQANDLRPRRFDPAGHRHATDRKISYFTRQRLRCLPQSETDSQRIVLVVGMPRSGTTLVEQILASHPQVFGGGESMAMDFIVLRLGERPPAPGYPECLDALSLRETDDLAQQYLRQVESPGGPAAFITDKMPLNCMHLGLSQMLLPQCRVIHCTRSPLDTCLSCYFTDFVTGNAFANNLAHLGVAYRDYQRLMAHWNTVIGLPVHTVRYEDLVIDLEGQSRRMLQFLGLPWDPQCLKFHEHPRVVHTASRDQVRQPVYLSSIGRWRNYQKHLPELIGALAG